MAFEETMTRGKEIYKEAEEMRWNGTEESPLERFREAADLFERATRLNPRSQEALYFLGYTYDRIAQASLPPDGFPSTSPEETMRISAPFERVVEIDQRYRGEMLILTPRSKITSIWGSLASAYAIRGNRDSAVWAFREGRKRGGFFDLNLAYCRNILASCEPNAILFVNGDADTYPTWYLQLLEGYRPDVIVLNLSLCNAPWFVRAMRNGNPFGNGALPMGYTDSELSRLTPRVISTPAVIEVRAGGRRGKTRLTVTGAPSGSIRMLRVEDQIIVNVLRMNNGRRPVYVSNTVGGDAMEILGLLPHLEFRGFASCFVPGQATGQLPGGLLAKLTTQTLLDHSGFDWKGMRDSTVWTDDNAHALMISVLYHFLQLGRMQMDNGNREMVGRLLGRMENVVPLDAIRADEMVNIETIARELYDYAGISTTRFNKTPPH